MEQKLFLNEERLQHSSETKNFEVTPREEVQESQCLHVEAQADHGKNLGPENLETIVGI